MRNGCHLADSAVKLQLGAANQLKRCVDPHVTQLETTLLHHLLGACCRQRLDHLGNLDSGMGNVISVMSKWHWCDEQVALV